MAPSFFRKHTVWIALAALLVIAACAVFQAPLEAYAGTETPAADTSDRAVTGEARPPDCAARDWLGCIANAILTWTALVTGLGGLVLNGAILLTVVNMGGIVGGMPAINVAWSAVRDLANILIIFALVWISIATILRIENYGAKKLLVSVIIAAVMVNFSLFITKTIIDVSNRFSYEFYKAINGGEEPCDITQRLDCFSPGNVGISDHFANAVRLITVYPLGDNDRQQDGDVDDVARFAAILMGVIVLLIAAFIFFSAGVLLVTRFVILIILMVLSPIAFVGGLLPRLKKPADKWWETLINQCLFAPFYLLLVYISLLLIQTGGFQSIMQQNDGESFANAFYTPGGSTVLILLNFMVIIGFMWASLIMAKSLGAYGAAGLLKWGNTTAANFGKGIAGAAWRNTVGAGSAVGLRLYNNATSGLLTGLNSNFLGRQLLRFGGISALDRNISDALEKGRSGKFLGQDSYADVKKKRLEREEQLSDTADEIKKRRAERKERNKNYLAAKKEFGKILGDAKKEDLNGLTPPPDGASVTDVKNYNDKERGEKKRQWVLDEKTGKGRWETDWEMRDRMEKSVTLSSNQNMRDARDDYKAIYSDLSMAAVKRMYDENPELLVKSAEAFTPEQTLEILKDKSIRRDIKDRIIQARHGSFLKLIQESDGKVAKNSDGSYMSEEQYSAAVAKDPEGMNGKVLAFSDEYYRMSHDIHELSKKHINKAEMEYMVTSNPGVAAGMQQNTMLWDAIIHGGYMDIQKSSKIAAGVKRKIRSMKRVRIEGAIKEDKKSEIDFEEEQINGRSLTEPNRDLLVAGHALDDAGFEQMLSERGVSDADRQTLRSARQNTRLMAAARRRSRAEAQADRWFAGKAAEEVQGEMKQESLGSRLVAKFIRKNQLYALQKDQAWMSDLRDAVFIHGNNDGAEEFMANASDGQRYGAPTAAAREFVEKERARRGLPPLDATPGEKDGGGGGTPGGGSPAPRPAPRGPQGGGGAAQASTPSSSLSGLTPTAEKRLDNTRSVLRYLDSQGRGVPLTQQQPVYESVWQGNTQALHDALDSVQAALVEDERRNTAARQTATGDELTAAIREGRSLAARRAEFEARRREIEEMDNLPPENPDNYGAQAAQTSSSTSTASGTPNFGGVGSSQPTNTRTGADNAGRVDEAVSEEIPILETEGTSDFEREFGADAIIAAEKAMSEGTPDAWAGFEKNSLKALLRNDNFVRVLTPGNFAAIMANPYLDPADRRAMINDVRQRQPRKELADLLGNTEAIERIEREGK